MNKTDILSLVALLLLSAIVAFGILMLAPLLGRAFLPLFTLFGLSTIYYMSTH
jgi:hypothetical protein